MKKSLVADAVKVKGSYYELGVKQGQYFREKGEEHLEEYKKMTSHADAEEAEELILTYFPYFAEELKGVADALVIDYSMAVRLFSGYNLRLPQMGCTSYINNSVYARNYDFSPHLYDARLVCLQPDTGYSSIGFSQQLTGRLDGMNEKGLVIGLHFVNDQYSSKGFVAPAIVRMVLDQCANAEEAAELIKNLPHAYCYNYSITDTEGHSLIIEAAPDQKIVTRESVMMAVNHFHSPCLQHKNRVNISGSCKRKESLAAVAGLHLSPLELFQYFNKGDSPYFFHQYDQYFGTLHTVVYDSASLECICGIGADSEPHVFSLSEFQEEWEVRKIEGYIRNVESP